MKRVLPLLPLVVLAAGSGLALPASTEASSAGGPASAGDAGAAAQGPPASRPVAETVAPDSPRAAILGFLASARRGRWQEASRYLDLRAEGAAEGAELARNLAAVLDHHKALDPGAASPRSEGLADDGLPPGMDEVAQIPDGAGGAEPVRMVRLAPPGDGPAGGERWVFSRSVVERIQPWYEQLGDRWLRERLPAPLLRAGPRGLLVWQWLALPVVVLAGWLFGRLFGWVVRRLLRGKLPESKAAALRRLAGPLTLFGAVLFIRSLLDSLSLTPAAETSALQLIKAGFLVSLFWALLRGVDLGAQLIATSAWARTHAAAMGLLPTTARVAKITTVAMALIAVLSVLGFPVASLLAGLGIGGLAIALAAQKTFENLIGSVAIGVDQPFKVGDFVRVDGVMGTVESIGLRSTRVRTPDRTVVSFPNGKLADQRAESFGPRDRILFSTSVSLGLDTPAEKIRAVVAGIEKLLAGAPKLSTKDAPMARLAELTPSAMRIEVMAWFETTSWDEFTRLRQDLLLGTLGVVERAGARPAALPGPAAKPPKP